MDNKLLASDIMTHDVLCLSEGDTLRTAAERLLERGVSGAPVCDPQGNLAGMLSVSDLIDSEKRAAAIPRAALFGLFPVPEETLRRSFDEGLAVSVSAIMSRDPVIAEETATLDELAALMVEHDVNRIPVLRQGRVVGIVSRADILRAIASSR